VPSQAESPQTIRVRLPSRSGQHLAGRLDCGCPSVLHGNPYDGHTLGAALAQVQRISGQKPRVAFVDLGYRGHGVAGEPDAQVVPHRRRHLPRSLRRWMNRRAAIEPVIGQLEAEHRPERNRLKRKRSDQLNAVL